MREVGGRVHFGVPPEIAFDYLSDPVHRAEWQSSLRTVADVTGEPGVGQRWTDVTVPGLRPSMETTVFDRPRRWAEVGTWRFVRAALTLTFEASGEGCEVTYAFRITGPGPVGPLGLALSALSRPAVGGDLKRAAKRLGGPGAGR